MTTPTIDAASEVLSEVFYRFRHQAYEIEEFTVEDISSDDRGVLVVVRFPNGSRHRVLVSASAETIP